MPLGVFAVVHADPVKDRLGRVHHYDDWKPDAYHVTEKSAILSLVSWKAKYPHRKWRVARLVEA